MSRWRISVVAVLLSVPLVAWAGFGFYYLWTTTWGYLVWWPLAACMALGYVLAWHWQRKQQLLRPVDATPPGYWTERDQQAWRLVEARGKAAAQVEPAKLTEPNFYLETAKEMALELARFYHPKAQDPVGSLTVPEILAVVELAAHDLAEMVEKYLPGGHLLTVDDWKRAKQLTEWYQTANAAYWMIAAVFDPIQTALRYSAAQFGLSGPLKLLQQNLQLWFYTAYVHRMGTYLIELNSGRLRVGAERYRQLLREGRGAIADGATAAVPAVSAADPVDQISQVTVTLLGQVKVGKSSLVNALLGERRAVTDVLPVAQEVTRYLVQSAGIPTTLAVLDTQGYGHAGPREDQVRATREAARQSDLLLLVLHARNPGRSADVEMLRGLREWFAAHPEQKRPPVLAVLTHIDLLSPAMEWSPPYDWRQPRRPKETQIRDAVAAAAEQVGEHVAGVVPVCVAPGKVHGVEEWLLPAVSELLDEVHAVALLRCLRAEADKDKVTRVFRQLLAAGKQLVKAAWQ